MKQSERCPKCESTRIWNNTHKPQRYRGGVLVTSWRVAGHITYVCTNCGYTEYYVDSKGLQTIEYHGRP
ncbi:MAG: hypothetical protein ACXAEJ_06855 [Candidatus Thorarchaeota archaeon]